MMAAIAAGYALVGGIAVYDSAMTDEASQTGYFPMPKHSDELLGGHALYFDRYTKKDKRFRFLNSWGKEWGDGGYGYIDFQYLDNRNLADDFWAMTAESPATTPWKD
jgi:C1A family cysteine protease